MGWHKLLPADYLFIYLFIIYSYFAPRRGSNIQVQSVTERDKIIKTVKNKT